MTLVEFFSKKSPHFEVSRPRLFNLEKKSHRIFLEKLFTQKEIQHILDPYKDQLQEYFEILNPSLVYKQEFKKEFFQYYKALAEKRPLQEQGRWAYFPWLSTVVHILEEEPFYLVRTARNQNLITKEEQKKFYNVVIGIAGLSVGNAIAVAIVLEGGAKHIRLVDDDRLVLSNLNRIRAGVEGLGLQKAVMTARQIYLLNPYAKVDIVPGNLAKENISNFFEGPPKLDIVIDEVDNLAVKYLIRKEARKQRIPVIMATDNGDSAVVDIERYDQNPNLEYFNGRMGMVSYEELSRLDKFAVAGKIAKHLGIEYIPSRMLHSCLEIGKTLTSWPQLGGTALLNGSLVAYCVRKILTRQQLVNNRVLISLEESFMPQPDSLKEEMRRNEIVREFKRVFGL